MKDILCSFFLNTSKVQRFCKFRRLHLENNIKNSECQFLLKKNLNLIKIRFFLMKKWEIQAIVFMHPFTRSSKRIFNPMRFTGYINALVAENCIRKLLFSIEGFLNAIHDFIPLTIQSERCSKLDIAWYHLKPFMLDLSLKFDWNPITIENFRL